MADPKDRRREARAPIELKVEYKRLNTFFYDYTKNISKGGTFIKTDKPLDIGTIFLDRNLRVKLYTAHAQQVFNLVEEDVGRQLSDITSHLFYDDVHQDVRRVLATLATVEQEVRTRDGRVHLMRLRPYRTADNRIEGVVLTFHDITTRRDAELRSRQADERLRLLIESAIDYAIFTTAEDGRIESWNLGAERLFGYTAEDVVGRP